MTLDKYLHKDTNLLKKYVTKIEEINNFYPHFQHSIREIPSTVDLNNCTEKEIIHLLEEIIDWETATQENMIKYYYHYILYQDTGYEDETWNRYNDWITPIMNMNQICKYINTLTWDQRKAILYNTEVNSERQVIVNKYIADEYKEQKRIIEKLHSIPTIQKMIKIFKEGLETEEPEYTRLDKLRLHIDEYAEHQKKVGIWTQEEVNKIKEVGFYYHRNDIEYNYYNKQHLLKLCDNILHHGLE